MSGVSGNSGNRLRSPRPLPPRLTSRSSARKPLRKCLCRYPSKYGTSRTLSIFFDVDNVTGTFISDNYSLYPDRNNKYARFDPKFQAGIAGHFWVFEKHVRLNSRTLYNMIKVLQGAGIIPESARRVYRACVGAATLWCIVAPGLGATTIRIDTGPQLFVDDYVIDSSKDLRRTLRQPTKDNGGDVPVLALTDEFGGHPGMLHANGTIVFDSKLGKYVMFSRATSRTFPGPMSERRRVYRFTSTDGITWIKGDEGQSQRIKLDIVQHAGEADKTFLDLFSCHYDASDPITPYKGWLYVHAGNEGLYYYSSSDGVKWNRGDLVTPGNKHVRRINGRDFDAPGDVSMFTYDPLENRYLGLFRFQIHRVENHLRSIGFLFLDRLDRPFVVDDAVVGLTPAGEARNGDQPWDEYYACSAWRYGSVWLGGVKVSHGKDDYPYSAAGAAFLKMTVSRDGLHWAKVPFVNEAGQPEVFIPNGREGGNGGRNDGGYICEFTQGPLRINDELIYYYGASSWGKNHLDPVRLTGGGIFRARLRVDGFVSVDGGELTTKPLAFAGENLFVNAVGPVAVELLDVDGKLLGRQILRGDSLAHKVLAGGRSMKQLAPAGVARLRFKISEDAALYSFAIK